MSVHNPLTTTMMRAIKEIEKESVSSLRFPNEEVLTSKEAKVNRMICLKRASVLGNIDHTKMKIIFKDSVGVKKVNTTVWAQTEKYIVLKGFSLIPLNRILDVY